MAPKGLADALIDKAYELREQRVGLFKQIDANRKSLRDLDTQGLLTAEETEDVIALYPPRNQTTEANGAGE